MPACEGYTHDAKGKPRLCGAELRNVGFTRGDDEKIKEHYVCTVEGCSKYKGYQTLPTKAINDE